MPINSRDKGARFERTLAKKLREYGYDSRRGQQFSGANGAPDVTGLVGTHIEAKAVEKLNIYNAMSQSISDAREGEYPVVMHKKNNCGILVTMRFEDWIELYREWEAGHDLREIGVCRDDK